jgi:hypothetical protein
MKEFATFIEQIYEKPLKTVVNGKGCQIATNERNALKAEICDQLFNVFSRAGLLIHRTSEGLVLAIPNISVEDENEEGVVSVSFKMAIKNLDYLPEWEEEEYLAALEEKEAKRAEREQAKAAKVERDTKARLEKKALRG